MPCFFLADHPDIPFVIHLTAISDGLDYRWGPLTSWEWVPSLVVKAGYFYNFDHMSAFLAQLRLDQLETEFRSLIEAVLAASLNPTHLDWHSLRIASRPDIFELMLKLAKEYRLALRVAGPSWIEKLQN
jgi:predicted glycoside hydrolase/deacetylase ChbG (UPF0249 family)